MEIRSVPRLYSYHTACAVSFFEKPATHPSNVDGFRQKDKSDVFRDMHLAKDSNPNSTTKKYRAANSQQSTVNSQQSTIHQMLRQIPHPFTANLLHHLLQLGFQDRDRVVAACLTQCGHAVHERPA